MKFGGGSQLVWGCMGCNGVEILVMVDGWMDIELYVFILEDNLLCSVEYSRIPKKRIIF